MTGATPPPAPALRHVLHLEVDVAAPIELGTDGVVRRRLVPITGGTVSGPLLTGHVIPGGADRQEIEDDTVCRLVARYEIETDRGEHVSVVNRALRVAPPDVTRRLLAGEPVDPALVYFRCAPTFRTAAPRLAVLNQRIFVATGTRCPAAVLIDVFQLD